jgi:hypothetical protein
MRLFNIFKKNKADKPLDKGTLFYHEDDYCQIELSPMENLTLFQGESKKINDLADKSFDGYGYTDIYVRNDNRIKLEERKIDQNELEAIVRAIGLDKATKVITGYGTTYRENCKNTVGFGKDYSAIYFDFKEEIVGHIWLTNHFSMDKQKLVDCLLQLGQKWNLLLVDWNQTITVDLTNRDEIEKYLIR